MNKHKEDLGTALEQEMAMHNQCDCDWCENYRMTHGFREIQDSDLYAIGETVTKDGVTCYRVNTRQKLRNRGMFKYCLQRIDTKYPDGVKCSECGADANYKPNNKEFYCKQCGRPTWNTPMPSIVHKEETKEEQ